MSPSPTNTNELAPQSFWMYVGLLILGRMGSFGPKAAQGVGVD